MACYFKLAGMARSRRYCPRQAEAELVDSMLAAVQQRFPHDFARRLEEVRSLIEERRKRESRYEEAPCRINTLMCRAMRRDGSLQVLS